MTHDIRWKLALSHLRWKISNVLMFYLPNKKLKHSHFPNCWPDWLAMFVINHGQDLPTNLRVLFYQNDVKLQSCRNFKICSIYRFTPKQSEIFILELPVECQRCSMLFPNFCRSELCHCTTFLTDSIVLALVCLIV